MASTKLLKHPSSVTGDTIRRERLQRGITRSDLSSVSGFSVHAIKMIESGKGGKPYTLEVLLESIYRIQDKENKYSSDERFSVYINKYLSKYRLKLCDLFCDNVKQIHHVRNLRAVLSGSRKSHRRYKESIDLKMQNIICFLDESGMKSHKYVFSSWLIHNMKLREITFSELSKYTKISKSKLYTSSRSTHNPRITFIKHIVRCINNIPVIYK